MGAIPLFGDAQYLQHTVGRRLTLGIQRLYRGQFAPSGGRVSRW